jgi:hypothetical protein
VARQAELELTANQLDRTLDLSSIAQVRS